MGRRLLMLFAPAAVLAAMPAVAAGARPSSSWAAPQIKIVIAHGLSDATDVASFHPNDALTQEATTQLVAGLQVALGMPQPESVPPANPSAPVTMAGLDARLVDGLGLHDSALTFANVVRAAGVKVPGRFGNEVTARLLGLRTNHPASQDDLELLPSDTATRAEAAYSAARVLGFSGWELPDVQADAETFALPQFTPWQQRILTTAFHFIGYPYVWGGTSERPEAPFGVRARGGFDCSGFVWRVYKLQKYPNERSLASTLRGRTTFVMSGEVPRSKRITLDKLQPADVIFFGAAGPGSRPAQVSHMGIYVGNGWFVHSSSYGVALANLSVGWYHDRFAWGRRPLAEAGLISGS